MKSNSTFMALTAFTLLVLLCGISLAVGPTGYSPHRLLESLFSGSDPMVREVLLGLRLPRMIAAVAIGAALSMAGLTLQTILANSLAEPYILGVSSGAAVGYLIAKATGLAGRVPPEIVAILFSLATILAVLSIARRERSANSVILTGVIISALLGSVALLFITVISPQSSETIIFWMAGSLGNTDIGFAVASLAASLLYYLVIFILGREIDCLSLGEETASSLGIAPQRISIFLLVVTSALIGFIVSYVGIIGFVGLVVPHITRMIVRGGTRTLVGFTALFGAIFLVASDLASRTVLPSGEIAIGIVTTFIGAPFFFVIMRRKGLG